MVIEITQVDSRKAPYENASRRTRIRYMVIEILVFVCEAVESSRVDKLFSKIL